MGKVEAINISKKKGVVKKEISSAMFIKNHGIEGDAHAGNWHRQISLLAGESIDRAKEIIHSLARGAFAENIITRGINLKEIKIGEQVKLGESVILEITQIGKECHSACAIKAQIGDCIMPREGIFAKVIKGGLIVAGSKIEVLNSESF